MGLENLKIKYATTEDMPIVRTLWDKLDLHIYGKPQKIISYAVEAISNLERLVGKPVYEHIKVCELNGAVAGVACLITLPERLFGRKSQGYIFHVYTEEACRGEGVASVLIEDLVRVATGAGCHSVFLYCRPELIPFYRRFSFEVEGDGDDLYSLSQDMYKMVLQLK